VYEPADPVVVGVADVDRSVGRDRSAVRAIERSGYCRPAIAFASLAAVAGNRDDCSRAEVDATDRMVLGVDDQQIAVAVDGQLLRGVEGRRERRAVVAGIRSEPGASDGRDDAGARINGAQCAPLALEDIDSSIGRDFDRAGAVDARLCRRPTIAAVLCLAGAGESPDGSLREIDETEAVICDIGNEQPGLPGVERETVRLDHSRARGGPVIAAEA